MDSSIANLLVRHLHATFTHLRQQYWILGARQKDCISMQILLPPTQLHQSSNSGSAPHSSSSSPSLFPTYRFGLRLLVSDLATKALIAAFQRFIACLSKHEKDGH